MSDGWEARMAERAHERAAERMDVQRAEEAAEDRRHERDRARLRAEILSGFTLGDALDQLRIPAYGCACPGPPVCCWEFTEHARLMVATAVYAVRLVNAYTSKIKGVAGG